MSEQPVKSVTIPFANRGVNLTTDVSLLADGEYPSISNMVSIQEGSLASRSGWKRIGQIAPGGSHYDAPHTIRKFRVGATDASSLRYIGEGYSILRTTDYSTYTLVATDTDAGDGVFSRRLAAVPYNAGSSGDPYVYFATPKKMLKDYGRSPYSSLRAWGLTRPTRPPSCALGTLDAVDIYATPATGTLTSTTSYVTVLDQEVTADLSKFSTSLLSGVASNYYDSDDFIELSITISGLSADNTITELKVELDCSTTAKSYVDAYVKSIVPSSLTNYTQGVQTAQEAAAQRAQQRNSYSTYQLDGQESSIEPVEFNPYTTGSTDVVQIKKSEFLKVGSAGTSGHNWSAINAVKVSGICGSLSSSISVTVTYVRMKGGSGPDATVAAAQPYGYVYTYRDPVTGNESNPTVALVEEAFVTPQRQPVQVTVYGTSQAGVSGGGSIAIYRAGGVFADNYYRLVGYATNPGAGGSVSFYDRASDTDIMQRRTVDYDNDPPVVSQLPVQVHGSIASGSISSSGSGSQSFTFSAGYSSPDSTLTNVLTVGSMVQLENGVNSEEAVISAVSSTGFTVWCQRTHSTSSTNPFSATVTTVVGKPCYLAAKAFDSLFVAGDDYNPHVLYKSKTGRPESFPFANATTGAVLRTEVGSPSNPIMNICEFSGKLVSLNLEGIYVVDVWNGAMSTPSLTPAQRGLAARNAWTKSNNEIWYLAHDGIYSWSGGQSTERTKKIKWLFQGKAINDLLPIDYAQKDAIWMTFCRGRLYFSYIDTGGTRRRLRYELDQDRWLPETVDATIATVEEDTGAMILAFYNSSGAIVGQEDQYGTDAVTDGFTNTAGTDGAAIGWSVTTPFYAMGDPTLQKLFSDVVLEISKADTSSTVTVGVYYDYATTPSDTFTLSTAGISLGTGRTRIALPLQVTSSTVSGKEAYAIAFKFSSENTTVQTTLHSLTFTYAPLDQVQRGRISDWSDNGHPHDKRLYELMVDFDTKGQSVTLTLDTLSGIDGSTLTSGVQTFTLSGRGQKTFPIVDGTVCKKYRLRSSVPASNFVIFKSLVRAENYPPDVVPFTEWSDEGHPFEKHFFQLYLDVDTAGQTVPVAIEGDGTTLQTVNVTGTASTRGQQAPIALDSLAKKIRLKVGTIPAGGKFQLFGHKFTFEAFPADIVLSTEYDDFGYDYVKYIQQVSFRVNTNNKAVPVAIYGDGALKQTVTITSTLATREQVITLNPAISAKMLRLQVDSAQIPSGGKFQLWGYKPVVAPGDKGPVYHTTDWDSCGHPHDKKFTAVTLEFETGGDSVSVAIDTLSGINGNTETLAAQTLTLTSTGRGFKTFPLNELVAKMIRVRSLGTSGGGTHSASFKMWKPAFVADPYPPDIVTFTDWDDFGYQYDKVFRGVGLSIDTGGVACTVYLDIDGVAGVESWTVTTTSAARDVTLSHQSHTEISGKRFRLRFSPGTGGKAQVFKPINWDVVRDAADFVVLDSFAQAYGAVGYTYIKQIFLDYKCAGTVTVTVYTDNNTPFYAKSLPAHSARDAERFYLPASVFSVLNKSKKHRIVIAADDVTKPVKVYRDSTRVEYMNLSGDARACYQQAIIWENIPLQV